MDDEEIVLKLEILKEVKAKALDFEKVKALLLRDIEGIENEDKILNDYRRELLALQTEKEMHENALKEIDIDIKTVKSSLLATETEKKRLQKRALESFKEYYPAKTELDVHRQSMGLEKLPEIENIGCIKPNDT